ncbi:hypothetical protein LY58_03507, partial [Salegentibacter salegens]
WPKVKDLGKIVQKNSRKREIKEKPLLIQSFLQDNNMYKLQLNIIIDLTAKAVTFLTLLTFHVFLEDREAFQR